ncbi:MAG TPA: hypothetical protein VNL71_08325 [Chloroflexota bacterium]|nr:hypothetical protein [Chloroflexota bacterium]
MASATNIKTKTNGKIEGMLITAEGRWRCISCGRITDATPVCAGAHEDGSPSCGKAVCAACAGRCVRCKAPLCAADLARSQEGALCVRCVPPVEGRQAYVFRQQARASARGAESGSPLRDASRAQKTTADAHESMDAAMRRADEIERQIEELKKRTRRSPGP